MKIEFDTLDHKIEPVNDKLAILSKKISDLEIIKCDESKFDHELD